MTDYKFTTTEETAARVLEWFRTRGGVAVWTSQDLGFDPGAQTASPALNEDGKPYSKPHWRFADKPEVLTDPTLVEVVKYKEACRFHVAVRHRHSGGQFKLTDAASRKLNEAIAKAGPGATHQFDFDAQEAVILVPEWSRSLADWAKEAAHV